MENLKTSKSVELISLWRDIELVWDPSSELYKKRVEMENILAEKLGIEPKEAKQMLNAKNRTKDHEEEGRQESMVAKGIRHHELKTELKSMKKHLLEIEISLCNIYNKDKM